MLWVLKLQHTAAEWTPCVAPDDSGEGSMAVVDSVAGLGSLAIQGYSSTTHCFNYSKVVAKSVQGLSRGKPSPTPSGAYGTCIVKLIGCYAN